MTDTPTYRLTSVLPRFTHRTVHKPYIWLAITQILDVITTGIILGVFVNNGNREGNPVVATLFHHVGLMVGLSILLVFKLAAVLLFWHTQFPVKIANAIYGLVVFNNLLILALAVWSLLNG